MLSLPQFLVIHSCVKMVAEAHAVAEWCCNGLLYVVLDTRATQTHAPTENNITTATATSSQRTSHISATHTPQRHTATHSASLELANWLLLIVEWLMVGC